jgi:hypothetical protein
MVPTGQDELDRILGDGFPDRSTVLVVGPLAKIGIRITASKSKTPRLVEDCFQTRAIPFTRKLDGKKIVLHGLVNCLSSDF